jgi:2-oxoisovalerate dehydrogenase E2 component (dihydrolipoyl transacylase)
VKIELPQVGESVTEGIIGKWLKNIGDPVQEYDPLVEVVTDKVNMEMPSPVTGILKNILVEEGQTVPMGTVIAEITVDGETDPLDDELPATESSKSDIKTSDISARTGTLIKGVSPVGPTGSAGPMVTKDEKLRLSPAVVRLANQYGIDLSTVKGTGIGGRITRKDVQLHIDSNQTSTPTDTSKLDTRGSSEFDKVNLTPVRRMIADNMSRSASEIPEAWTMVEVDVTNLVDLRNRIKPDFQHAHNINITYLSFVLQIVAGSLKNNPLINSVWGRDSILLKRQINIGVAVATEEGLLVPVVKNADSLNIQNLAKTVDDITTRARTGNLKVDDVQGGTFTVNNTGAIGSVIGKALINYPQAAILNTESIVKRPVVIDDSITIRSMMNLCLTFDHRIIDGAQAGAFVTEIKKRLESIDVNLDVV